MQKDIYTMLSLTWIGSFVLSLAFSYLISKYVISFISLKYWVILYVSSVILIDIVLVLKRANPNLFVGLSIGLLMGLFAVLKNR